MDRSRIERQLKLAQQELSACEKQLDKNQVAAEDRGKNAKWRKLDADTRAIRRRLNAVQQIEEREAAANARKSEKSAEVAETSAE